MRQAAQVVRAARPDRRLGVPLVLAVAGMALAVQSGSPWFLLVAGAAAGVVVDSLLERDGDERLALCLHAPSAVRVGDAVVLRIHVDNQGPRTSPPVHVGLDSSLLSDDVAYVGPLAPGARAEIALPVSALARGVLEQPVLCVRTSGPLGLLRRHRHALHPRPLVVRPAIASASALLATSSVSGREPTSEAVAGDGLDVLGVREWRAGDDPARVHWRSTVRHGFPVVLERERQQQPGAVLVVVGSASGPPFEDVVARSCSSSVDHLNRGARLRVVVLGARGARDEAPAAGVDELLDWWAGATASGLPDPAAVAAEVRPGEELVVAVDGVRSGGPAAHWWPAARQAAGDGARLLGGDVPDA